MNVSTLQYNVFTTSGLAKISQEVFILLFKKFQVGTLLVNYSSKHGIHGDPKTNFLLPFSVNEFEKSNQIKSISLQM